MERLVELWQKTQDQTVKVKSQALTPALFFAAIALPTGSSLLLWGTGLLAAVLGTVAVVLGLALPVGAYVYFACKDPDRLGSEAFVIQQGVLTYAMQKGDPAPRLEIGELIKGPQLQGAEEGTHRE